MTMRNQSQSQPLHRVRWTSGRAYLASVLPLAVLLALFNLSVLASGFVAARLYVVTFLLVVPGAAVMARTSLQPREASVRLAWSVGASMLVLMFLGLAYSLLLPHLGDARPLSTWSIAAGVDVVTVAALAANARRSDPLSYLLGHHAPRLGEIGAAFALCLLPLAAMAGAERLNGGHSGALAVAVLVAVLVVYLASVVAAARVPAWMLSAMLYSTALATTFASAMRSSYPFGSDIQSEYRAFSLTMAAGAWHLPVHGNAYDAMLSITVLPTILVLTSHVSGIYLFKVMYPVVFGLFPVLVYAVSARWFSKRAALLGAVVVIAQGFYAADITAIVRQDIGLLYFALFVVTAFDEHLPRVVRQVGVVVSAVGMAISHYSTAYFACVVLLLGYVAYLVLRLARRRSAVRAVLSLPVVVLTLCAVFVWNVVVTRSAENVTNLVTSISRNGLDILPASRGTSLISRILNADVTPSVTPAKFLQTAVGYYRTNDPWIHPYPAALTRHFPIGKATISGVARHVPAVLASTTNTLSTVSNELLLLLVGIGILLLVWQERRITHECRAEFAALALGCLALLALLRTSAALSSLYNAPRGQVQGALLLSVGLALVCDRLFALRWLVGQAAIGLAGLGAAFVLFANSGLSDYVLVGNGVDTLANAGEAYQRYYFTDTDIASASWLGTVHRDHGVVYADIYGGLQLAEVTSVGPVVATVLPQVLEPRAYVYATSTNIVDHTARANVDSEYLVYRFPKAFLDTVKDVVFSTATTRVYL